jgi:peptidyl-prolyl cis-trans isomerase C
MPHLRAAVLGLALSGLTVSAQTPGTAPATTPGAGTAPAGTATATSPAAPKAPAVSPTAVAVKVNGEPIYESTVQRALERVPPNRRELARPELINYLANNLLIDQSLRAAGYKAEPAEVEKRIGEMKADLKKMGRDFDKMLAELKVTEAELRDHIAADLRWFKYASAQATDKALGELFNGNKDMFDGTTVKAQHILMSPASKDPQAAATVVAQLRSIKTAVENEVAADLAKLPANTDKLEREKKRMELMSEKFAKYAREKSECPSKSAGGAVGPFPKSGYMVAAFSNAAFAMQPYQMTDVVQTPFGFHLIMVTERKPGREVKFEEVKEVVKEVYLERLHEGVAAQLRQKARIEVMPAPK